MDRQSLLRTDIGQVPSWVRHQPSRDASQVAGPAVAATSAKALGRLDGGGHPVAGPCSLIELTRSGGPQQDPR